MSQSNTLSPAADSAASSTKSVESWEQKPLVGGKLLGAHVAKRVGPEDLPDPDTLGLALSAQSPIANTALRRPNAPTPGSRNGSPRASAPRRALSTGSSSAAGRVATHLPSSTL